VNTPPNTITDNQQLKFAVVGAGHIGKRHAEMIRRNPHAKLVAMVDILPPQQCGIHQIDIPFFSSLNELITANLSLDVVCICTPNGLHVAQTIQALKAGHHVVCEKPLALSTKDAKTVLTTAEQTGKHVFCVKQNRYSPPSVWIKDVIDKQLLGKLFIVQVNCFWNRDERYYQQNSWRGTKKLDGGTLFTQFSHFIDMMYWLFGDITNIRSKFADFAHQHSTEFEDSGIITFDFLSGAIGSFHYSTAVVEQNLESSMTIIGEKGSVKIGGQYMNEVQLCNIIDYQMPQLAPTNAGNHYGSYIGSAANHNYVIQNVIDTLLYDQAPTATLSEGITVVDMIERIYNSTEA